MKNFINPFFKSLFFILLLKINNSFFICSENNNCTSFIPISQGQNLYTQYHKPIYLNKNSCWASEFNIIYRFSKTNNSNQIACYINNTNPLLFVGGGVENLNNGNLPDYNRPSFALVPEYFGLSDDTNASVYFSPVIKNNIIDLQASFGGEKIWFQINAPIVNTDWQINGNCFKVNGKIGNIPLDSQKTFNMSDPGTLIQDPLSQYYVGENRNTGLNSDISDIKDGDSLQYINNYIESNADLASIPFSSTQKSMGLGFWQSPDYGIILSENPVPVLSGTRDSKTVYVNQPYVENASSIKKALGLPGYNFGEVRGRKYNLFNFNSNCNKTWGVADLILQLGYDFFKEESRHLAFYLRGIIPTGTKLDSCWLQKGKFAPIVGNGNHYELGIGINTHINFCIRENSHLSANFDGYVTHMFASNNFRSFDLANLPMSRYAIVKNLLKNDSSYNYLQNMNTLGDLTAQNLDISCGLRSELVLDLMYIFCNWKFGLGYAFSGQSSETNNCESECCSKEIKYYGFKGISGLTKYIIQPLINDWYTSKITINDCLFAASTNSDIVDISSGAYNYGVPSLANDENVFSNKIFTPNSSGLMHGQVLNRLFAHIDYIWKELCFEPEIGIFGSIGFCPEAYVTAQYWDVGARIGIVY